MYQTIIIVIDCLQAWVVVVVIVKVVIVVVELLVEVIVVELLAEVIFVVYKLLLYESVSFISSFLSQTSILALPYQLPLENNLH